MVKSALIGLNVLGILFLSLLQKNNIEITHDLPSELNPGEEQVVTVNIDKSDVTGFAKFQVTVMEGMTIEPVETSGSSFTFNNHKAKFIWMALPSSKKFTIKYRVIASNDFEGTCDISSRFSYIYESERKNFDIADHTVVVGDGDAVADISEDTEEKPAENANAEAQITRSIAPAGVNQWKVNVEISKSQLEGFGKIEEIVPKGFTAIDLKSSSAVFAVEDQLVKYIWYDISQNDKVVVTYKLLPVIAMEEEEPEISGTFTYLKNEMNVVVDIKSGSTPDADETPVAAEDTENDEEILAEVENLKPESAAVETNGDTDGDTEQPEDISEDITGEEAAETELAEATDDDVETTVEKLKKEQEGTIVERDNKDEEVIDDPEASKDKADKKKANVDGNMVDVPDPERGIFYRVQIAAGHNNLKKETFAKLYAFTEGYKIEPIDGWIKYTTGYHEIYKSARNDRERIKTAYEKFQGPFVTAYNEGVRITVQEALMITDQQWYQ
ncbi:MAG: hypothetical protein ABR574_01535 [Cryomorphaceae bacterium]|nr:hypothetical protein [Flavobacteriales bacterium]